MAIKCGGYIISHPENGKVWISKEDGEGGQFNVAQVEEALDVLWRRYF